MCRILRKFFSSFRDNDSNKSNFLIHYETLLLLHICQFFTSLCCAAFFPLIFLCFFGEQDQTTTTKPSSVFSRVFLFVFSCAHLFSSNTRIREKVAKSLEKKHKKNFRSQTELSFRYWLSIAIRRVPLHSCQIFRSGMIYRNDWRAGNLKILHFNKSLKALHRLRAI